MFQIEEKANVGNTRPLKLDGRQAEAERVTVNLDGSLRFKVDEYGFI